MYTFTYKEPASLKKAITFLQDENAAILAGGTDIIPRLKGMVSPTHPDTLVNIKAINPGNKLDDIKKTGNQLKIGALATLADIAESQEIITNFRALAQAAGKVASPELRNMGTIGGNLCQFVRCWYYRVEYNQFPCKRKGGSVCYVWSSQQGDDRYHSIFGAVKGCFAVNPSDIAPALIVLDAKLKYETPDGSETIEAKNFFSASTEKTTVLADDEILTEIQILKPDANTKTAFVKFAARKAIDFAIVNCAAAITIKNNQVSKCKVCLNGVYNYPKDVSGDVEPDLVGKQLNEQNAEKAANNALSSATARMHNEYKIHLAKAMVKKAILKCQ
jgi:xanthine dehydrogenase YagS FAD-binding subunit